jgi:hypothetical protein
VHAARHDDARLAETKSRAAFLDLPDAGIGQAALGVVLVGLVFVIIVLHELGHALGARSCCSTRR